MLTFACEACSTIKSAENNHFVSEQKTLRKISGKPIKGDRLYRIK